MSWNRRSLFAAYPAHPRSDRRRLLADGRGPLTPKGGKRKHPVMIRRSICAALLVAACHHEKPATTAPPDATTSPAVSIAPDIVAIAARPGAASKFKLRVEGDGSIAKQSLYHTDAAAVPADARAKAEAKWPGSKASRYETEHYAEYGRVDEVEVTTADGKTCELAIKADGTELYEECEIDPSTLPAAVAAKVGELFPGGKILEAESKRVGSVDEFTIEVESSGQEFYLRCGADGTVLAKHIRIPAVFEVPIP